MIYFIINLIIIIMLREYPKELKLLDIRKVLDAACEKNDIEIVKFLLEFDPNQIDAECDFEEENIYFLKYLKKDSFFYPYINIAVKHYSYEVLEYFLQNKILKNIDSDIFANAAVVGDRKILEIFIKSGKCILEDGEINHAFFWASLNFNFITMIYLYELYSRNINLNLIGENCRKRFEKLLSIFERTKIRAAKKIYFWIIPKLYAPDSVSAYNIGMKGYEKSMKGELL